jgi:hypothetical protein
VQGCGAEPAQPPGICGYRAGRAPGDLLAQQEGVSSLVEGVSIGFFGGFRRG